MPRQFITKKVPKTFTHNLVEWLGTRQLSFCFLGSGWGKHIDFPFDLFAGEGCFLEFKGGILDSGSFIRENDDFIFTAISYDIKNQLESLTSHNPDHVGFDELQYVIPKLTFLITGNELTIGWRTELSTLSVVEEIVEQILTFEKSPIKSRFHDVKPTSRITKDDYLKLVRRCQHHIQLGDIYQANICQEFFLESVRNKSFCVFSQRL